MKTKLYIILSLNFLSHLAFGQDPNCRYLIALQQIETEKYEYRFFLEDQDFERIPFDDYHWYFASGYTNNSEIVKYSNGKKLGLIQKFYTHCSVNHKNDLRVLIGRKNKKTNEIEFMYTEKPVEESDTEIIFKKFKAGKQKARINRSYSFTYEY